MPLYRSRTTFSSWLVSVTGGTNATAARNDAATPGNTARTPRHEKPRPRTNAVTMPHEKPARGNAAYYFLRLCDRVYTYDVVADSDVHSCLCAQVEPPLHPAERRSHGSGPVHPSEGRRPLQLV